MKNILDKLDWLRGQPVSLRRKVALITSLSIIAVVAVLLLPVSFRLISLANEEESKIEQKAAPIEGVEDLKAEVNKMGEIIQMFKGIVGQDI